MKTCINEFEKLFGNIKQLDVELTSFEIDEKTKDDKDVELLNLKFTLKVKGVIFTFNVSPIDSLKLLKKYNIVKTKVDFGEKFKGALELVDVLYMINNKPYLKLNKKYYPVFITKKVDNIKIDSENIIYFIDSLITNYELFSEYDYNVEEYIETFFGSLPYRDIKKLEKQLEEEFWKNKKLFENTNKEEIEKLKIAVEKCIDIPI